MKMQNSAKTVEVNNRRMGMKLTETSKVTLSVIALVVLLIIVVLTNN